MLIHDGTVRIRCTSAIASTRTLVSAIGKKYFQRSVLLPLYPHMTLTICVVRVRESQQGPTTPSAAPSSTTGVDPPHAPRAPPTAPSIPSAHSPDPLLPPLSTSARSHTRPVRCRPLALGTPRPPRPVFADLVRPGLPSRTAHDAWCGVWGVQVTFAVEPADAV